MKSYLEVMKIVSYCVMWEIMDFSFTELFAMWLRMCPATAFNSKSQIKVVFVQDYKFSYIYYAVFVLLIAAADLFTNHIPFRLSNKQCLPLKESIALFSGCASVPVVVCIMWLCILCVKTVHYELIETIAFLCLFQAWVLDSVTNDFQDGFIVDVEPNEKAGYV